MAKPAMLGPITPTMPLRVAVESSTARLVNANIGSRAQQPADEHEQ